MSYGTESGVSNNLIDYSELIDQDAIDAEMVSDCREAADGIIDAKLASAVPVGSLPLESPPAVVDSISDDLATYFLLRRLFTGKDPNDSEWVDKFYERPLELLDSLVEDPQIVEEAAGEVPEENNVYSSTPAQDRIFTVGRTSGGQPVSSDDGGSMDEWRSRRAGGRRGRWNDAAQRPPWGGFLNGGELSCQRAISDTWD